MNGQNHYFLLLSVDEIPESADYLRYPTEKRGDLMVIPNALVEYTTDFLKWIPSFNVDNISGYGLNMYGITIINQKGASILRAICSSWASLFSYAPDDIYLTGKFFFDIDEDGNETERGYEQLYYKRSDLVNWMQELAQYADKVSSGSHIIVHFGL